MNRERLEHQITILRAVEAASLPFNMESWIGGHGCGTAACAFGYAALDPQFQAEGLTLRSDKWCERDTVTITTAAQYNDADSRHTFYPWYAGAYGFTAAEEFFDLDGNEAEWLFDTARYSGYAEEITPVHVIARIEHLLAGGEADPEPVDDDYDYDDDNEETL